jgi:hypothetical protein
LPVFSFYLVITPSVSLSPPHFSSTEGKITDRGIETPLGILTLSQIEQGEKILSQISTLLAKAPAYVCINSFCFHYFLTFRFLFQACGRNHETIRKILFTHPAQNWASNEYFIYSLYH